MRKNLLVAAVMVLGFASGGLAFYYDFVNTPERIRWPALLFAAIGILCASVLQWLRNR